MAPFDRCWIERFRTLRDGRTNAGFVGSRSEYSFGDSACWCQDHKPETYECRRVDSGGRDKLRDARDVACSLIESWCPGRASRQAARHFGLDHQELASIWQQFDVAAPAGTESEMANHTVGVREAFTGWISSASRTETTRQQCLREPPAPLREHEFWNCRGMLRGPIEHQPQHPPFIE